MRRGGSPVPPGAKPPSGGVRAAGQQPVKKGIETPFLPGSSPARRGGGGGERGISHDIDQGEA